MSARKNRKRSQRGRAGGVHTAAPVSGGASSSSGASASADTPSILSRVPDSLVTLGAALALCLLIAVCFFPATQAGFIWDDLAFTSAQPVSDWSGLWQIWFTPGDIDKEGHYWPALYTTFWLEHKLWGFNPLGYHIVNLLLHAGVTLLLWHLLRRLEVPGAWAWVAAAVFAVHPLHVESVAWVIGRKDLLATLFYLAAALNYIRFAQDPLQHRRHYAFALAFFMLSLMSKSIAVTFPVALLLWHWWRRGRVTGADLARALPFLLLGVCVTVLDWLAYKNLEQISFDYSQLERVLLAAQALWFYVGKLLWPTGLAVIYPKWEVSAASPAAWGYFIAAVAVVALLWFYRRRITRAPLAAAAFFAVTLSPTLGFVDYGYMQFSFVADRYQYLAGAGVIALGVCAAAWGAQAALGARKGAELMVSAVLMALAFVLLIPLGIATWQHAGIYRSEESFFRHITTVNPRARLAFYNLGREYIRQERYDDAHTAFRSEYRFALAQQPLDVKRLSKANLGIGIVAERQGRIDEAAAHYRSSMRDSEIAFHRLATLLSKQKRYREALELYETFVQTNPNNAKLHSDMGITLFRLNRPEEALQSFERALVLDPDLKEALGNREAVLKSLQGEGG